MTGTTACVKHCCDLSQYTDLQRPSSSKILVLISSEVEVYDLEMLKQSSSITNLEISFFIKNRFLWNSFFYGSYEF